MKKKLFGTDGVRGLANQYPMTPEIAMSLGQAIAYYFRHEKTTHRVVIGKDTRRSSYMLELAIAAGVCSMGSSAVLLGPTATPGVAFITKAMRADAGVMISASHNPYEDNGIKFFDRNGYKLSDETELEIESLVAKGFSDIDRPYAGEIGKAYRVEDALGRYVEFIKNTFPRSLTLDGLKIVIDCANGASYKAAPMALWELGAEVISLGVKPNGTNINKDCGALFPQHMAKEVVAQGAQLGVALDGDADRLILCDENGSVVDGDQVIALCARHLLEEGVLDKKSIVGTIMTNMGVENYLLGLGFDLIRTAVGDRYIIEEMRKSNIQLGGEPSGHVIFSDHATTGDGLVAALQVLACMVKSKKKLSELVKEIPLYPQVNKAIRVKEKKPLETVPLFTQAVKDLEARLKNKGRAVVRYSGTEPVLRLMIEGENKVLIQGELDALTKIAEESLC